MSPSERRGAPESPTGSRWLTSPACGASTLTDITVASFFSGIGLLDLGLEWVGFRTVSFSEIDPYASRILALRFPGVPNLGDIHGITEVPPATLWAGGFPCQPVSVAGRQRAQDDARWLWPRWVELIREFRPPYLLLENVANLLAVNGGRAFGDVLGDLAASGYDAEWDCIPASAVGAPHQRDRVWIVGVAARKEQMANATGDGCGAPRGLRRDALRERTGSRSTPPADADREHAHRSRQPGPGWGAEPTDRRPHVADPDGARGPHRLSAQGRGSGRLAEVADDRGDGGHPWGCPAPGRVEYDTRWWAAEPRLGRVAHGVPHRVDRLRCLGNGVVPQVAEFIGWRLRAMIEAQEMERAA